MRRILIASVLFSTLALSGVASAQDDDVGSSVEGICCGATCCLIGGVCYQRDDENPADSCQVCDPSATQTDWTDVPMCGGTDAGSGGGTDAGPGGGDDGGCSVSPARSGGLGALALGLAAAAAVLSIRRRRR